VTVRGVLAVLACCAALAACDPSGGSTAATSPSAITTTSSTTSPASTPASASASSSPAPDLPAGVPVSFDRDLPSGDVPTDELVPRSTDVTGTWYATTSAGEAIVVSWAAPGADAADPFVARGVAVWRRFDDGGAPWRPVYGVAYPKGAGVYAIGAVTGDMTGDGSDDALVFAETGGSGGCGTYDVIDLAAGSQAFDRQVCDTQITPSADPPGLTVIEAVYQPDDPHCCPSATRTTIMTYDDDGTWHVASRHVIPTG
jgi:hypothetical protein